MNFNFKIDKFSAIILYKKAFPLDLKRARESSRDHSSSSKLHRAGETARTYKNYNLRLKI